MDFFAQLLYTFALSTIPFESKEAISKICDMQRMRVNENVTDVECDIKQTAFFYQFVYVCLSTGFSTDVVFDSMLAVVCLFFHVCACMNV